MDEKQQDTATRDRAEEGSAQTMDQDIPEGAVEIPVEIVSSEEPEEQAAPAPEEAAAPEAAEESAAAAEQARAGEQTEAQGEDQEAAAQEADQEAAKPSYEELETQVSNLQAAMEALRTATEEQLRDVRMRNLAELENFKKRLNREHSEHLKYAAENVMKDLIPSLDNLELAILYGPKDEACQSLLQGVEMTSKLLLEAVGRHGLERIGKEGDTFDPALHEAIGTESRDDLPSDSIARVMQSGYSLQGRLLRPAKVMVNKR